MKISILNHFKDQFGLPQIYVKSPGRANIIGEHTDYNQGLVLPFAVKQCIHLYLKRTNNQKLRVSAIDLNEKEEIEISDLSFCKKGWIRYFINALVALGLDHFSGIDVVFGGNLPQGCGVSSSSAITCGFLAGVNTLFSLDKNIDELIDLASQAENGIGLKGGIMDQTSIFKGEVGHALKIDFLDHSIEKIPLPLSDFQFYLFNSGQKHDLVETEYNDRRETCESALKELALNNPNIQSLRDVTKDDLDTSNLDSKSKKRVLHVIQENERVIQATQFLKGGTMFELGKLLTESHKSLSNNYEVSTVEIDYLVQRSLQVSNILGGRIMGGGFGGSAIHLVQGKLDEKDIHQLKLDYTHETGLDMEVYEIEASSGLRVVELD